MSLTGNALIVVLSLVAIVLFVLLVWGRPHFHNAWAGALVRAGYAVALNLAVVSLAGAMLNDQYGFYVDWADLFGVTSPAVQAHTGGTTGQLLNAKVQGAGFNGMNTPANLPPLPKPGSRQQTYTVTGSSSGIENKVIVQLPPGYNPQSNKTYPVILALHGFPGTPEQYASGLPLLGDIDSSASAGLMKQAIVIMPQIDDPPTLDTECVNAPGGLQTETWLAHDLPQWATGHFRVDRSRTSWAAFGFSYGGWCAAMLTIKHPDIFGAGIIMQGYFRPDFSPNYKPFSTKSAEWKQYDLVSIARKHPPAVALWVVASEQDALSFPSSSAVIKNAHKPLSITANLFKKGGHTISVWGQEIPKSLVWLGRTMPGFAANAGDEVSGRKEAG